MNSCAIIQKQNANSFERTTAKEKEMNKEIASQRRRYLCRLHRLDFATEIRSAWKLTREKKIFGWQRNNFNFQISNAIIFHGAGRLCFACAAAVSGCSKHTHNLIREKTKWHHDWVMPMPPHRILYNTHTQTPTVDEKLSEHFHKYSI